MLNIVFLTGYAQYSLEAYGVFPSGYLLKPITQEKLEEQVENLRNALPRTGSVNLRVQTFGHFTLYADGNPVHFSRKRSQEVLAFLVDRHGAKFSQQEIARALLEEDYKNPTDMIRPVMKTLRDDLQRAGAERILKKELGKYRVDTTAFTCDLYEYEQGLPQALNAFHGEYMKDYSWGEVTLAGMYGEKML